MLRAKLHHQTGEVVKTMTPEQWRVFCDNWPGITKTDRVLNKDTPPGYFYDHSTQRITLDEGLALESVGVLLDIEGLDGTMLTKMRKSVRNLISYEYPQHTDPMVRDLVEGSVVNVSIPDLALLSITKVTWLDDSCTEDLQSKLDEGWRILAVCPPNSQRRPDYILGWCGRGDPP